MRNFSKLMLALALFAAVIAAGTLGYRLLTGADLIAALYMTVITITTVGYSEVVPLDNVGRLFTMGLILTGFGTYSLIVIFIAGMVIEGELRNIIGRKAVEKKSQTLQNHFIICGFGRIGQTIAGDLAARHVDFVVIEHDRDRVAEGDSLGYTVILGDATDDEVLERAGIRRARGLIAVMGEDARNVFVTLSARQINPTLYIVARGEERSSEPKLKRAGADRVVLPYVTGAHQIAHAAIYPNVIDFIDFATRDTGREYTLEEVRVAEHSRLANHSLAELNLSRRLGLIVIGIKRNSQMIFNPSADEKLLAGDIIIVIGKSSQVNQLDTLTIESLGENRP
ncbi:MAG: potassium channel protein [Candidatus Sumerlaeia bacterium]